MQPLRKFRQQFQWFILNGKKILFLCFIFYMPKNLSCSFLRKSYLPDRALNIHYTAPVILSQLSNLSANVSKFQILTVSWK